MSIPRNMSGTEVKDEMNGMFKVADYVVGQYNEQGTKIAPGRVIGSEEEVTKIAERIVHHAASNKAEMNLPTEIQPKKGRRKSSKTVHKSVLKVDGYSDVQPKVAPQVDNNISTHTLPLPSTPQLDIVFLTTLGKIRVKPIGLLECDTALTLIFKDNDSITYEPEAGHEVRMLINNIEYKTFYSGFKFPWLDSIAQLMVFAKL